MKTQMKTQTKKSRFSHIALALALSVGTVGGMASFLALTEVAEAKGNGGGGAGGGGEPAPAAVKANNNGPAINRAPPINPPPQQALRAQDLNCGGSRDMIENESCRHNARSTPRIVRINGFANCAVVQQIPGPNGGPAEFYCLRPM